MKAQTVSLFHRDEATGELYLLNLIDTPGHVDFSYEVSRSISACQGALLLVDCTKGVQAQTVANFWLAFEQDLAILPIVNKVDLGHADVKGALEQMATAFDTDADEALCISAKTGAPPHLTSRPCCVHPHAEHTHAHAAHTLRTAQHLACA